MRVVIIFALLLGICFVNGCAAPPPPPPPPDTVSVVGTWQLVKGGGLRANRSRFKLMSDSHYTCVEMDTTTGTVRGMHGGSYSLKGNTFTESVEFADSNWQSLVNMNSGFQIRLEGDRLRFAGKYHNEVWQRVPEGAGGFIKTGHTVTKSAQSPFLAGNPAPAELSSELSKLLRGYGVNITFSKAVISPEGDLILTPKENAAFAKGATIKVGPDNFRKLNHVAQQVATLIKINEEHMPSGMGSSKLGGIDLSSQRKVPVRYE